MADSLLYLLSAKSCKIQRCGVGADIYPIVDVRWLRTPLLLSNQPASQPMTHVKHDTIAYASVNVAGCAPAQSIPQMSDRWRFTGILLLREPEIG